MNLRNKMLGIRALLHFDNRWQLIFNRLFFKNNGLLVYRTNGLELLVDHAAGDHNGTRLCLISDIYSRFLPKMELGNTVSVFDLGANGGGFPLMLIQNGKRFSKLVCVEMNPNTFRRLQYNISQNVAGDVVLIQAAVCGAARKLNLSFGSGDISDSIYRDANILTNSSELKIYSIVGRTFDDLFYIHFGEEIVDICKIDIEGAEYEVLAAPDHKCLRFCRYLIIEIHERPSAQQTQLVESLITLGFSQVHTGRDRIPGEYLYRNSRLLETSPCS